MITVIFGYGCWHWMLTSVSESVMMLTVATAAGLPRAITKSTAASANYQHLLPRTSARLSRPISTRTHTLCQEVMSFMPRIF